MGTMAGYVFISFSTHDADYVRDLIRHLRQAGVDAWSSEGIRASESWVHAIRARIDGCVALVPVMTPEAEESAWVTREILYAERIGKPVVPLLLRGRPFIQLANVHHENVSHGGMPSDETVHLLMTFANQPPRPGPKEPAAVRSGVRDSVISGAVGLTALLVEAANLVLVRNPVVAVAGFAVLVPTAFWFVRAAARQNR
jgi:TIR domain